VSLLSHENTDIAIGAIQTISEFTDEDVEAEQEQWNILVNAMVCLFSCGVYLLWSFEC
jgi:beta-catenin-like protein 1